MANVNGTEINLMPTEGMREEAQRYRNWKKEGEGGGTDDARTRATQILSGNQLSPDTVITMNAWFARHQSDKSGKGFRQGEEGYPSNGRVAWAAWGGDAEGPRVLAGRGRGEHAAMDINHVADRLEDVEADPDREYDGVEDPIGVQTHGREQAVRAAGKEPEILEDAKQCEQA